MNWRQGCKKLKKDPELERLNSSCVGKFGHSTSASASNEVIRMSMRFFGTKEFRYYLCEFCGKYHVGGVRPNF